MGNCWPAPVNHHSPSTTKTSSPSNTNEETSKREKHNTNIPETRSAPLPLPQPIGTGGGRSVSQEVPPSGQIRTPDLKMFTFAELKSATINFSPDTVVGEGGFGRVFKGWVDHKTYAPSKVGVGIAVAVKKSSPDSVQGLKEWQAEVKFLGKFKHPNLVRLLGYCWEDREFLLVYEYMQKGSLESHLFRNGADEPLTWETRLNIAIGAARGLEYLHCKANPAVIYRDLKSANILLDNDFNPKLSDFGLAKLGPVGDNTHVSTRIMGTYGYCAPEYAMTGKLNLKSDIYSFGVVMLELITGRKVIDSSKKPGEQNLVSWSRPFLSDQNKFVQLADPVLQGRFPVRSLHHAVAITAMCLQEQPNFRPLIGDIVVALEYLASKTDSSDSRRGAPRSPRPSSPSQKDTNIYS